MNWQDRSWIPSDSERQMVANLVSSDSGQVLLRLLDEEGLNEAVTLMSGPDFLDGTKLAFMQGRFQTLQLVISWLTAERDEEEENA